MPTPQERAADAKAWLKPLDVPTLPSYSAYGNYADRMEARGMVPVGHAGCFIERDDRELNDPNPATLTSPGPSGPVQRNPRRKVLIKLPDGRVIVEFHADPAVRFLVYTNVPTHDENIQRAINLHTPAWFTLFYHDYEWHARLEFDGLVREEAVEYMGAPKAFISNKVSQRVRRTGIRAEHAPNYTDADALTESLENMPQDQLMLQLTRTEAKVAQTRNILQERERTLHRYVSEAKARGDIFAKLGATGRMDDISADQMSTITGTQVRALLDTAHDDDAE